MFKPDPERVNELDWEFMLSGRFPFVPRVGKDDEWAHSDLDWVPEAARPTLVQLRRQLVNAWPSEGADEGIAPLVRSLEEAFDKYALNKPAVSTSIRGEFEKATERARRRIAQETAAAEAMREESPDEQPQVRAMRAATQTRIRQCHRCMDYEALPGDNFCAKCKRIIDQVAALQKRGGAVVRAFKARGLEVHLVKEDEQLMVEVPDWGHKVIPLTAAERWLDNAMGERHTGPTNSALALVNPFLRR